MVKEKAQQKLSNVEDFLIAEYSEIFQEFRRLRDEGVRRLNFFVTLSTGVLGGIIFLYQISSLGLLDFKILAIVSLSLLFILGWGIFRYQISRDVSADFNMRAMGRIRRYFINCNPEISNYLLWNTNDEPSHYLNLKKSLSSVISTMAYFLGILLAFDVAIILSVFVDQIEILIGVGSAALILSILILFIYAKRQIKKANKKAKESVKFPSLSGENS